MHAKIAPLYSSIYVGYLASNSTNVGSTLIISDNAYCNTWVPPAFPGEDISDRPLPEESVPGILQLITQRYPSGRYLARALPARNQ